MLPRVANNMLVWNVDYYFVNIDSSFKLCIKMLIYEWPENANLMTSEGLTVLTELYTRPDVYFFRTRNLFLTNKNSIVTYFNQKACSSRTSFLTNCWWTWPFSFCYNCTRRRKEPVVTKSSLSRNAKLTSKPGAELLTVNVEIVWSDNVKLGHTVCIQCCKS